MCELLELSTAVTNAIFTSVAYVNFKAQLLWYICNCCDVRQQVRRSKLDRKFLILVRILCTLPSERKQSKKIWHFPIVQSIN